MREVGLIAGLVGWAAASVAQMPSFTLLDLPPGSIQAYPTGLSADGRIVSGYGLVGGRYTGYTWTREGGLNVWGTSPGVPSGAQPNAISGDGSVIVGMRQPNNVSLEAFRYAGGQYQTIPYRSGYDFMSATAVSHDGSVIVGGMDTFDFSRPAGAMRWTPATGTQYIGLPRATDTVGKFSVLSRDGRVAAGVASSFERFDAFTWTEAGGWRSLPVPAEIGPAHDVTVTGINGDGSIVAGYANTIGERELGVLWQNGVPRSLGTFGSQWDMAALNVSNDGAFVVGTGRNSETQQFSAVVWPDGATPVLLQDYLESLGIVVPSGFDLKRCRRISSDGLTLTGEAQSGATIKTYVVTIPTPTTALVIGVGVPFVACRRRRTDSSKPSPSLTTH